MVKQNQIPNEPELMDLLNLLKKDTMLNTSVHHVGIIQIFDPLKQTATVKIAYTKTFYEPNPLTGDYDPKYVAYPILLDCPVVSLGGGNGALTFPITSGDECLVLFNDRDIDNWFQGTGDTSPASLRLHSLSDGFALVGIRSRSKVLNNFSNNKTQLYLGDAKVSMETDRARLGFGTDVEVSAKASKILVKNSNKNLRVILQTLIDKLTDLDTAIGTLITQTAAITVTPTSLTGPSSAPLNAAMIVAVQTDVTAVTSALATIKTDLGALLE